jgi:HAMP domain-containing protein
MVRVLTRTAFLLVLALLILLIGYFGWAWIEGA